MPMSTEEIRGLPAAVTIPQACAALGISVELGYSMVEKGEFPGGVVRCGRRIIVPKSSLLSMLRLDESPVLNV